MFASGRDVIQIFFIRNGDSGITYCKFFFFVDAIENSLITDLALTPLALMEKNENYFSRANLFFRMPNCQFRVILPAIDSIA